VTRLGDLLRLYRAAKGLTVRELAPTIGISPSTLHRIERGHAIDAATLLRVLTWLLATEPTP
jgi:transcriptional regulator with XRE-family HTH domain